MKSKIVNFQLSSDSHPDPDLVQTASAVHDLNIKYKRFDINRLKSKFPHLKSVLFEPSVDDTVSIITGADILDALLHLEFCKGRSNEPITVKTLLG